MVYGKPWSPFSWNHSGLLELLDQLLTLKTPVCTLFVVQRDVPCPSGSLWAAQVSKGTRESFSFSSHFMRGSLYACPVRSSAERTLEAKMGTSSCLHFGDLMG